MFRCEKISPCKLCCRPFVQVEVKKAEPRDSKAPGPGQIGANQWGPRGILSAANGWTAPPAQGWQQSYGPQGVWVSTGQPIGGYGPPLQAGRGAPAQPPSPFNAFLVTATPAGSFAAPQGYPQQGYSTPPQFGQSWGKGFSLSLLFFLKSTYWEV